MKRIALAILIVLLIGLAAGAAAHPGKTDSKGGHYDHSTGEYHYHHGYPAHQHGPNGECPYNNDDKTDHSTKAPDTGVTRTRRSGEYDNTRQHTSSGSGKKRTTLASIWNFLIHTGPIGLALAYIVIYPICRLTYLGIRKLRGKGEDYEER